MAARKLKPMHSNEVRAKIQASQLINRLTDHAFDKVQLSATQIRAIEILLKKSVPDLSAIDITGNVNHDVAVTGALTWQPPQ